MCLLFLIQRLLAFTTGLHLLSISPHIQNGGATQYPTAPDLLSCSVFLGRPLTVRACQAALDGIPRGTLPTIFTTRARTASNNFVEVPQSYKDNEARPGCEITIDLDGHSQNDKYAFVPFDAVREMGQKVINTCVSYGSQGRFITYGLKTTIQALLDPTSYDGSSIDIPAPATVQQPDGTTDYTEIAIPDEASSKAFEYSKSHVLSSCVLVNEAATCPVMFRTNFDACLQSTSPHIN